VEHPGVDKICFTGSTATGRLVMKTAAEGPKKVSLELGGKSPNIVFADADLDAAVRGALTGIFYGKGEVCAAGSRLLIERSVREEFVEKLAAKAAGMTVGDPTDSKTRIGALVSAEQRDKVLGYIDAGREDGAKVVAGGNRADVGGKGYFVEATVFDEVDPDSRTAQEEIFGPVLATLTFDDVEDAVSIANRTIYGLAAGVWTRDVG
jgi:acyl-CoA reductase-like NAD-dependent aldehyde dehydrogenase